MLIRLGCRVLARAAYPSLGRSLTASTRLLVCQTHQALCYDVFLQGHEWYWSIQSYCLTQTGVGLSRYLRRSIHRHSISSVLKYSKFLFHTTFTSFFFKTTSALDLSYTECGSIDRIRLVDVFICSQLARILFSLEGWILLVRDLILRISCMYSCSFPPSGWSFHAPTDYIMTFYDEFLLTKLHLGTR